MKKIHITGLILGVLFSVVFFTGCKDNEDNSNTTTLNVFGPSPALRGGELKFIGVNLDKVTSVVLSSNVEVTDFVSKSSSELIINIPQDAQPGTVVLKTPLGDITTKTQLTFSEPISIDTYTTSALKAGDVFTINGDYLNNVAQVIFTDGAVVDSSSFISQSRKKIEVTVPKAAKTGKVAVSNGAQIPVMVYTEGEVTINNPVTISGIAPLPVKPGENLTISGTYLGLIKTVVLPDGNQIDSAAITLNAEKTTITVKVPLTAKEGAVKLVTYAGAEMTASQSLTLVPPAVTGVSQTIVKNGTTITITGTNLDLVAGATFANGVAAVINSQSETSIELGVPLTAGSGAITLVANSGQTATTESISMLKPTISSISPLSLVAGGTITITGTDLDLVRKVVFVDGTVVEVNPVSDTSFDVTIPTSAVGTGIVTLKTVNGDEVTSQDQLEIIKSTKPAITTITANVAPGGLMTITGKNLNYVESIYFQDNVKAVLYGVRSETSITVYVPVEAKKGKVTFTMNSFSGEEIISPEFNYGADPITANTVIIMDYEVHGGHNGYWDNSWSNINSEIKTEDGNTYIRMTGSLDAGSAGIWIMNCNHQSNGAPAPSVSNIADYVIKVDVKAENDFVPVNPAFKLVLGNNWSLIVSNLLPMASDGVTCTTGGGWVTVTLDPVVLGMSGALDMSSGTNGLYLSTGTMAATGLCFDNLRLDPK